MSEIKRWKGIRNTVSEERFKAGDLMEATNVDLDNSEKLLSRKGFELLNNAAGLHSLYANDSVVLVAQGTRLKAVEQDFSLTDIADLRTADPVSYETVGNTVYYSNIHANGILVGRSHRAWGVTPPVGQPQASAAAGTLPPGTYSYAMTYKRFDGYESGTGVAGQFVLENQGGILLSALEVSTNPLVYGKIVYLSGANGEAMYRVAEVPNSQTSVLVQAGYGGIPLRTQHMGPAPAGSIVRYYNGVMYVVVGDTVYFSMPYELELFGLEDNFLRFPAGVAMFEPVRDGIFVATVDKDGDESESSGDTWFLSGAAPGSFSNVHLFDYGAIPGTSVQSNSGDFESPFEGEVEGQEKGRSVAWSSRKGICVGFDGGSARNLTLAKYAMPAADRGAALIRRDRGYTSYIVALQGAGAEDNIYTRG